MLWDVPALMRMLMLGQSRMSNQKVLKHNSSWGDIMKDGNAQRLNGMRNGLWGEVMKDSV